MRRPAVAIVLVVVGVGLMFNPVYLPIDRGESEEIYTHTVQPVDEGTPSHEPADVVDVEALDEDAADAFYRARTSEDGGFSVNEPDERVGSLSYPDEPEFGDGLLVVAYDGQEYEFWTRTVEADSPAVVTQRLVVQPVAFLAGFFAVLAAAAIGLRNRLDVPDRPQ